MLPHKCGVPSREVRRIYAAERRHSGDLNYIDLWDTSLRP
jgi:hypothetical protein